MLGASVQVDVHICTDAEVTFDLSGVDASVANALRRAMIAEVPTMAIENVRIEENASVMLDDVLIRRLGLMPIAANPEFFERCQRDPATGEYVFTDTNSIEFELDVGKDNGVHDVEVYSGDLVYKPMGAQAKWSAKNPSATPRMAYENIPICKLRPGQRIKLECSAILGTGREHAKWSPAAPASYRPLPEVVVHAPDGAPRVTGQDADDLKALCPLDVFDIEDLADGTRATVAARPRDCTMCRECVRDADRWGGRVELSRRKDYFIFSVESTLAIPAPQIVSRALQTLRRKCSDVIAEIVDTEKCSVSEGGE